MINLYVWKNVIQPGGYLTRDLLGTRRTCIWLNYHGPIWKQNIMFTLNTRTPWPWSCWTKICLAFANNVHPDQMASEKPSDLDLTVGNLVCEFLSTALIKQSDWLTSRTWDLNLFSMTTVNTTCWGKFSADDIFWQFPEYTNVGFDISCKLSPLEIICMKCHNLFFWKKLNKTFCQFVVCWISP